MGVESQIHLGVATALKNGHSVIVSMEHYTPRQINKLMDEMGPNQTLTIKQAQLINYQDMEKLSQITFVGKLVFDFSEEPTYKDSEE